jgi:crossover junction endodeoxyribonuclease RuvC
MRVLGVDPGMATTGYGVVEDRAGRPAQLACGVLRAEGLPGAAQLALVYDGVRGLIREHRPDVLAVEQLLWGRNVRTAMGVGQARGVVLLAAAQAGVEVREYTPTEIKLAVSGYGGAGKAQVQSMVRSTLGLRSVPRPDDAADALAVAITCLQSEPFRRAVRL